MKLETIEEKLKAGTARENTEQCKKCDNKDKCYCEPHGHCEKGINITRMGFKKEK
jgi:hypothetical protein